MAIVHDGLTIDMREVVGGKKLRDKESEVLCFATTDGIAFTAHLPQQALGPNSACLCITNIVLYMYAKYSVIDKITVAT